MQKLLAVVLALFTGISVQATKLDSLITVYKATKDPDKKAIVAFDIASETIFSKPSTAAKYLMASMADSSKIKDKVQVGKLANALGIYYYNISNPDSSIFWSDYAIYTLKPTGDSVEYYKACRNKGLPLSTKGEYSEALDWYLQALAFLKRSKDTLGVLKSLNDIGNTYLRMKDLEQGLRFQKEALGYFQVFSNPAVEGNILNSIGFIFDARKEADSAIFYYSKSLELKKKSGNIRGALNTQSNLCACLNDQGNTKGAINCYQELLVLQQQVEDFEGVARTYSNLGVAFTDLKQLHKALEYHKMATDAALSLGNPHLTSRAYLNLAGVYRRLGRYTQAYDALLSHNTYRDSSIYAERNKEATEWAVKYDLGKKDLEISEKNKELLEAENEKLQADLAIKQRNQWLFVMSLLIAGGLVTAVIVAERNKAKQEKAKTLAVLEERDKGLKAIIDAQEEERTRIARELHDGVGNQLLALKMRMKSVLPPDIKEKPEASEVEKALLDLMEEVRGVSHQMMPKALQEFGCVPAIKDMLEKILAHSGIEYTFETHNVDKRYELRLETAIYRVTQELINNVIKHSGATFVTVQLIETAQTLVLLIEDNGQGMHQNKKPADGIGMTSIKTRVTAVNGVVNILPGENTGTVVTVRIPLNKA